MDAHTVVEEWDVTPYDGGAGELQDLESRRFSGAVEANGTWLFLAAGEPVAALADLEVDPRPADADAVVDAGGRLHEAPTPAAARLAAMLALDGEVRGQYFTDDVSLAEVDETLSDGGFTGYVELSENVLSGDYYVVYEDGVAGHLGFVGSGNRLLTGEEAEEKAENEVGIYSVVAVDLPDVDLPTAGGSGDTGSGAAAGGAAAGGPTDDASGTDDILGGPVQGGAEETDAGSPAADEPPAEGAVDADPEPTTEATPEPASEPGAGEAAGSTADETPDPAAGVERDATDDAPGEPAGAATGASGASGDSGAGGTDEPTDAGSGGGDDEDTVGSTGWTSAETAASDSGSTAGDAIEGVTTRTVPSLDPEKTEPRDDGPDAAGTAESAGTTGTSESSEPDPTPSSGRQGAAGDEQAASKSAAERASEEVDRRLQELRAEHDRRTEQLREELAALREERDRLQQRVASLESEGASESATAGRSVDPATALAETKLLVRENTRGEATLEEAHAGRADRETLAQNLRIEYHTSFDESDVSVDGDPYESWLGSTLEYRFAEWLVVELLFEIQSTGARSSMRHIYDALPEVDNVVFDEAVTVGRDDEERRIEFDVVVRNRMDEPLVVVSVDEDAYAAGAESVTSLVEDAVEVCDAYPSLAAAVSLSSSPFESGAFDAADEATSGSLLSREKYRSFVKLSRSNGFHLCLVESGDESFYLRVPEL